MLLLCAKRPRPTYGRRFGESFKGPIIPFGAMVEYHPIPPGDQARVHHFGKKVLPGIFPGYLLVAGEFGKEMFWLQIWKIWKFGCIRYLPSKNQRERIFDQTKRWWIHIPSGRWYSKIVRKRLRIPRTHSEVGTQPVGAKISGENFMVDAEARADSWSIQGDFICRHHNEPRVQLYVPQEETFPIPLKYIDVTFVNSCRSGCVTRKT